VGQVCGCRRQPGSRVISFLPCPPSDLHSPSSFEGNYTMLDVSKQLAVPNVPTIHSLYDLKQYPHWVCYDARKVPVSPRTGKAASSRDSSTWGTYAQARQYWARQRSRVAGLGFMLTRELGIIVIDLDHCIVDGQISAFAQQIVESLDSYTEISPGGTGLHIWVQGKLPENLAAASKADGEERIEMYCHARYLTVTGKEWRGGHATN
jgi:hypothetical protein